jgi:hypothetical protein
VASAAWALGDAHARTHTHVHTHANTQTHVLGAVHLLCLQAQTRRHLRQLLVPRGVRRRRRNRHRHRGDSRRRRRHPRVWCMSVTKMFVSRVNPRTGLAEWTLAARPGGGGSGTEGGGSSSSSSSSDDEDDGPDAAVHASMHLVRPCAARLLRRRRAHPAAGPRTQDMLNDDERNEAYADVRARSCHTTHVPSSDPRERGRHCGR